MQTANIYIVRASSRPEAIRKVADNDFLFVSQASVVPERPMRASDARRTHFTSKPKP